MLGSGIKSFKVNSPLDNYVDFTAETNDNVEYILSVRSNVMIFNRKENGSTTRIWSLSIS